MMDTNIKWIHHAYEKYVATNSRKPISISDWHNEDGSVCVPWNILKDIPQKTNVNATKYLFLDSNNQNKEIVKDYIETCYGCSCSITNITITHNSTAAIYLAIKTLIKSKCNRFLIITPSYFSTTKNIANNNCSYLFYHLKPHVDFKIDITELKITIEEQYIDCIVLTDPIFCTGIPIDKSIMHDLVECAKEYKCWMILDKTISGLDWDSKEFKLLGNYSSLFSLYENIIVIDSPTKKLFLNGLKHAVVFSTEEVIDTIESMADEVTGSFAVDQMSIIPRLYDQRNVKEVSTVLKKNVNQFEEIYRLINTILHGTNFFTPLASSGFHSIILHRKLTMKNVNSKKATLTLLNRFGVYAIPLNHFGFHESCNFGFRINLSKHHQNLIDGVLTIANKELDFL
jgi:aspartate/methionine/tyrosine aminotransferase